MGYVQVWVCLGYLCPGGGVCSRGEGYVQIEWVCLQICLRMGGYVKGHGYTMGYTKGIHTPTGTDT